MKIFITIFALIFLAQPAYAKRLKHEAVYLKEWCAELGGKVEHLLEDNTRVDCLTDTHAIEFDFGDKWAESIGQALHYSLKTGKAPGIVLILEDGKDVKYLKRVNTVNKNKKLGIKVWNVGVDVEMPCDLKGNINKGKKIYHSPGQQYYDVTRVNVLFGEKWFCTHEEAEKAGWRHSKR